MMNTVFVDECVKVAQTVRNLPYWKATATTTVEGVSVWLMRGMDEDGDDYINVLFDMPLPPNVYVLVGDVDTYGLFEGLRVYL